MDSHNQPLSQGDPKTPGSSATYHILTSSAGQHLQQTGQGQQPTYILIPATQPTQQINVTSMNTSVASSSSTPIRVVNQGSQREFLSKDLHVY